MTAKGFRPWVQRHPVIAFVALAYALSWLAWLLGGGPVPLLIGGLGTFALVAVVAGGLEEPGWRGFALPHLQRRHTPISATLILGMAWGVWHLPVYGPVGFVVRLVLAFFYTWLYNRTGSVLLSILLHASFTPAQNNLILLPSSTIHPGHGINTIDLVILGTYLVAVLALVILTRGHLGHPTKTVAPQSIEETT